MNLCPYCTHQMNEAGLRSHFALNKCGLVPPDTCLPFPSPTLEDPYRKEVEAIAREMGLLVAHVQKSSPRSGKFITPTTAGFPDTWFVSEAGGVLVVEFKSSNPDAKLKPEQAKWLMALDRTLGVDARMARPEDWPTIQHFLTKLR